MKDRRSEMRNEISFIDLFRIMRKRKKLFFLLLFFGSIAFAIYVILLFPSKNSMIRVDSFEIGKILNIIDPNVNFLSKHEFSQLIKPIIYQNIKEKRKYELSYEISKGGNDLATQSIEKYSLLLSRKFGKREDEIKAKFRNDLKDFFKKFGKNLFSFFYFGLKKKKIEINRNLILLKKSIEQIAKRIDIVRKYKNSPVSKYVDSSSDISTFFLPPNQQYYGLLIKRDNMKEDLNHLNNDLHEISGVIKIISENGTMSFPELSNIAEVKQFELLNSKIVSITKRLDVLQDRYCKIFFISYPKSGKIFFIFALYISLLFFLFIFIFFIEWLSRNKNAILGNEKSAQPE